LPVSRTKPFYILALLAFFALQGLLAAHQFKHGLDGHDNRCLTCLAAAAAATTASASSPTLPAPPFGLIERLAPPAARAITAQANTRHFARAPPFS